MLFFVRKLAEALATPIGLSILLVALGLLLRRRWVAAVAIALLWLASTSLLGDALLYSLERTYPARSVSDCPPADAIVVLSGSVARAPTLAGPQWGESVDRFLAGVALAKAGKAPLLIFTEGARFASVPLTEGQAERREAISQGVPPGQIRVTGRVQTTADESRQVAAIPGLRSLVLVTSGFHMPRAVLLFRAQGLQVIPFPTDSRAGIPAGFQLSSLMPTAESLLKTDIAIREFYGLAVYRATLRPLPTRQ